MDEKYKKALERIEILEKELARIKQAIMALAKEPADFVPPVIPDGI